MPATDTKNLQLQISANAELMIRTLKVADGEIAAFQRSVDSRLSKIDKAFAGLGAAGSKLSSLAGGAGLNALIGAATLASITSLVSRALEYASSLAEVAQQLGVTTKTLQEYRYVATQVGIDQEKLDDGLGKLTRSIGQAGEGSKKQVAAFASLGVSIRDANGELRSTDDVLPDLIRAFSDIPNTAQRAALEVALFGKSGQQLDTLLAGGVDQINNLRDAAKAMGVVLSEDQIANADRTADKLNDLKTVLSANIAGAVADNSASIYELTDALTGLIATFPQAFSGLKRLGSYFANDIGVLTTGVSTALRYDEGIRQGVEVMAAAQEDLRAFRERQDRQSGAGPTGAGASLGASFGRTVSRRPRARVGGGGGAGTGRGSPRRGGGGGGGGRARAGSPFVLDDGRASALATEGQNDIVVSLHVEGREGFDQDLANISEGIERSQELARIANEQFLEDNPLAALRERLIAQSADINKALQDVAVNGLGTLEDSLLRVIDGTESLGDLFSNVARSIIADLARIAIQQAFTSGISAVFGGSASTASGALSSIFGGKRERGGSVTAGRAYVVGERRPEMFVPSMSGTILPQLPSFAGAGGGDRVGITYAPSYAVQGSGPELSALRAEMARDRAEFPARATAAIVEAKRRNVLR